MSLCCATPSLLRSVALFVAIVTFFVPLSTTSARVHLQTSVQNHAVTSSVPSGCAGFNLTPLQCIVNLAQVIGIGCHLQTGGSTECIPYSWGAGHENPLNVTVQNQGFTMGTCAKLNEKPVKGAPAPPVWNAPSCTKASVSNKIVGLDCSGFTRLIYGEAYGKDVLGSGTTRSQVTHLHKLAINQPPKPGYLVYWSTSNTEDSIYHVGIVFRYSKSTRQWMMIDAPHSYNLKNKKWVRAYVREEAITGKPLGYYYLTTK